MAHAAQGPRDNPAMLFAPPHSPLACSVLATGLLTVLGLPAHATSPATSSAPAAPAEAAWRACTALVEADARLACFDRWAGVQAWQAPAASAQALGLPPRSEAASSVPSPPVAAPVVVTAGTSESAAPMESEEVPNDGCRNPAYSELARFWELEAGSGCGTFRFRGYRPLSVSVVTADEVNRQPSSPAQGHQASSAVPYRTTEMRVQLSVRTKLAQGLLTPHGAPLRDSLWFGYTQQSYWQLFSGEISRPFRTTDHEPELVYVYPTALNLPAGGRLRFAGLGLVHHSNGQSLPLSRSWNRHYLMAGAEWGPQWQVQARVWKRIAESRAQDDNPDISDLLGRGELRVLWNPNPQHTLGVTVRHALRQPARGSTRLEWLRTLGEGAPGGKSNLRLHAQLFHGYGDSLVDYNRRRTVFSLGLSLLDF